MRDTLSADGWVTHFWTYLAKIVERTQHFQCIIWLHSVNLYFTHHTAYGFYFILFFCFVYRAYMHSPHSHCLLLMPGRMSTESTTKNPYVSRHVDELISLEWFISVEQTCTHTHTQHKYLYLCSKRLAITETHRLSV